MFGFLSHFLVLEDNSRVEISISLSPLISSNGGNTCTYAIFHQTYMYTNLSGGAVWFNKQFIPADCNVGAAFKFTIQSLSEFLKNIYN